jgi:hypothetical protein
MPEPATAEPPSPGAPRAGRRLEPLSLPPEPPTPARGLPEDFRPARPLRTAAFLLAPASLPVALWVSGVLPTSAAPRLAGFLVLLALVQVGLRAHSLHQSRRLGDALLRAYPGLPPVSALAAWRSGELTSARNRRYLVRQIRQFRRETEACMRSSAQPVATVKLDESIVLLSRLEHRLAMLSRPVSPLGMLDVHALATGGSSPLYFPQRTDGLPAALAEALSALEPA